MPDWSKAERQLRRHPVFKPVIAAVGPCTLATRNDHFVSLCGAIFSQQLNVTVAKVLFDRFRAHFPRKVPTPAKTVQLLDGQTDEATLRHVGLSRQKRAYVLDLARHFADGRIKPKQLGKLSDDEVIENLTAVKGVGRWTAEMHLIFALGRPDVWPVDDLGIQESYRMHFGLSERPKPRVLEPLGDDFRPWRSVASWYLWRGMTLRRKLAKENK